MVSSVFENSHARFDDDWLPLDEWYCATYLLRVQPDYIYLSP